MTPVIAVSAVRPARAVWIQCEGWELRRAGRTVVASATAAVEGRRAPGAAPIRVLHWFDCKVAHYLAKQLQAATPAVAAGAAPVPLHPEIAARPEWARQPPEVRHRLKWALDGWGLSGSDRRRKLKMVHDLDKRAWPCSLRSTLRRGR
ncbi:MAG: hypothetical protein JO157_01820 [Acetobacteraceae bacterium]|nr:hypothetical protein [Acetobacteraceae bacterium]